MVELISSLENNSFIFHSFVEFLELSLSPDLCRFDSLSMNGSLCLGFVCVPLGRRFSTERQVDRSAFVSSRLLPVARRIRPCRSKLFVSLILPIEFTSSFILFI